VETPRQLLFDDRAFADADFVNDELSRRYPEDELCPAVERDERPLAGVDRRLADLAGRRIRVELLNGPSEES
jgi:hypothetical protein